MANLQPYGAPVKISPLIKFTRYTFLGLGILYGLTRNSYLQKKDREHKAYVEKMTPVWENIRKEKIEELNKNEIKNLEAQGISL